MEPPAPALPLVHAMATLPRVPVLQRSRLGCRLLSPPTRHFSAGTLALPLWGDLLVLPPLERTFGSRSRHSPSEVTQLLPRVQHLWGSPELLLGLLLRDGQAAELQSQGRAVCPASRELWQQTRQLEDTQMAAFWPGTCGPSLGPALGLHLQVLWWQHPCPGTTVFQAQALVPLPSIPHQVFIPLECEKNRHGLCRSVVGPQACTAWVRAPGRETLGAGTLADMSPTAHPFTQPWFRCTHLCPHPGLRGTAESSGCDRRFL